MEQKNLTLGRTAVATAATAARVVVATTFVEDVAVEVPLVRGRKGRAMFKTLPPCLKEGEEAEGYGREEQGGGGHPRPVLAEGTLQ